MSSFRILPRSARSACALLTLLVGLTTATSPAGAAAAKKAAARSPVSTIFLPPPSTPLEAALGAQVRQAARAAPELGVVVVDLADGSPVFEFNPATPRILASNTKILTTAAALDGLGPEYSFETWLFGRGPVEGGSLRGDLAVIGGGDPNISERQSGDSFAVFRGWAAELRRRGISVVDGDLYLVHGFFEDETIHPDWPRDQLARWYEAPIAALSFNDNCLQVRVWPSKTGRARVDLLPRIELPGLRNFTSVSASSKRQRLIVTREPESWEIETRGQIWSGSGPADFWITVPDPVTYFGAALRAALADEGVTVRGSLLPVRRLPDGHDWESYAVHRSDLLTTLEVINKHSQNFYAESLLKTLGAELCARGTWEGGLEQVSQFLASMGILPGSYEMSDGSGMSRNNRFTPTQLVRVLQAMYHHRWGDEFIRTLPYSGEPELSWRRRLADGKYRGNVFAKTGTLNGVSTLSGYARAASGKIYAFSILCNQARSVDAARRAQDQIVRALIDHG
jgi:D-alanyl-D-alanine carboxypeptidase/D-alanyl-D-alanine-endopeptidase (penicillin-binding protein 4)